MEFYRETPAVNTAILRSTIDNSIQMDIRELVAGLIIQNHKLALVCNCKSNRRDRRTPVRLEPPGGKVEGDERWSTALLREIREELRDQLADGTLQALDIGVGKKLCISRTHSDEGEFLVHMFLCSIRKEFTNMVTNEPKKLRGVVWASAKDLRSWAVSPPRGYTLVPNIANNLDKILPLLDQKDYLGNIVHSSEPVQTLPYVYLATNPLTRSYEATRVCIQNFWQNIHQNAA